MRKIQCADCGKRYDYDVDDFCPRCGSFNPPPDSGATRLEEELLSRFQRPGTGGQRSRTAAPRPTSGSGPEIRPGRSHGARLDGCAGCGPEKKKGGAKALVIVVAVLAVLFAGVPLVEALAERAIDAVYSVTDSFRQMEEHVWTADEPASPEGWYEPYDTIPLSNGQMVTVGGALEVWLPDSYWEAHPDSRCVAVSLWVLGAPEGGAASMELRTEDGGSYLPVELPPEVLEEYGLTGVSLADGLPDEEIWGYSFYLLPETAAGQDLTAVLTDGGESYVALETEWEE